MKTQITSIGSSLAKHRDAIATMTLPKVTSTLSRKSFARTRILTNTDEKTRKSTVQKGVSSHSLGPPPPVYIALVRV